jgi:biopolymer transport protein ExbB/TolQ
MLIDILYWVSTAMLIPVIVLLLILFVKSLLMLGGFYGLYINRLKLNKSTKALLARLKDEGVKEIELAPYLQGKNLFSLFLKKLFTVGWKPVHCEKFIADFEIISQKELESSKTLMRIGPMLGLMGTLIPMGPALVGLAAGDIAAMAHNMQIAFSTTVIGIFIGAIGFLTQLIKQRWFVEELNDLQYIYELANGKED